MDTFGELVRRKRIEALLSVSELARRAGISHSHLLRVESGEREPSLSIALGIAAALETPIAELAGAPCRSGSRDASTSANVSDSAAKSTAGAAKRDSRKHKRISK